MESEALVQHQFFPGVCDPRQQNALDSRYAAADRSEWDVKAWNWDGLLFLAQPSSSSATANGHDENLVGAKRGLGSPSSSEAYNKAASGNDSPPPTEDGDAEGLTLKLGGKSYSVAATENGNGKRQRSSSPVAQQQQQQQQPTCPTCQVDDCKADLSTAKDYHRRHKVCEMHSKAAKASVGLRMQRFCQQCSRFHPLEEFDEGKRSCRRRLAGHNRRRRKTQPDAAASQAYLFAEDVAAKHTGVLRVLQLFSQLQAASNLGKVTPFQEADLALDYLKRATSVSTALRDLSSPKFEGKDGFKCSSVQAPPFTTALLDALSIILQTSRSKDAAEHHLICQALYDAHPPGVAHVSPAGHTSARLPTADHQRRQEDFSEGSPSVQRLFPLHSTGEAAATSIGAGKPVEEREGPSYFGYPAARSANDTRVHHQQSSDSQSGSDQSPESFTSDLQERTGRISFKLFNRTPGDFPSSLRSQIIEWLSHVPSDMESYIRPGCVVLAIFLSMPFPAWQSLCDDFAGNVKRLLDSCPGDFWHKGHILVQVDDVLAYVVDGKIEPVNLAATLRIPKVLTVKPVALPIGKKADFVVQGYELRGSSTRLFSAYQDKYDLLSCDTEQEAEGEEVETLSFAYGPCHTAGRCFIEVERDGWSSFAPVIVADEGVCKELGDLEDETARAWLAEWCEGAEEAAELVLQYECTRFLEALGWLLQKTRWKGKGGALEQQQCEVDCGNLKRLLVFALERNWLSVCRLLLDTVFILKESPEEAIALLDSVMLLHRAVARNKAGMVNMLLSYRPTGGGNSPVFSPNSRGLAGLTPLHVAASTSDCDALVAALTSSEGGLRAWNSIPDSSGRTPSDTALARGNLAYIQMVWSSRIPTSSLPPQVIVDIVKPSSSAAALEMSMWAAPKQQQQQTCRRQMAGIRGPMYKPFMLSMVAIAAVCVCVCLLLKGPPEVNFVLCPFTWESVQFGPK